ncbi:MAG TPA: GntR family transcriptional regulator [Phenylobacterium sp.]|nr:GntR family transcriptional regulator [Phenylobacterium sp.]
MATLADSIELALRADLVTGVHPPGGRLQMEKLAERYGAGMSPVREALSRLYAEGLVSLESNKGFRVPALSREDLADIAFARVATETAALRRAIELGDIAWEASLVSALHTYRLTSRSLDTSDPMRLQAWQGAHDELHRALVSGSKSPRIEKIQQRLLIQHARYRQLLYRIPIDFNVHEREHVDLVEAVLARDVDVAVNMLASHIAITLDVLDDWGVWTETG